MISGRYEQSNQDHQRGDDAGHAMTGQLRIARAEVPPDPAERTHVVFSAEEAGTDASADWCIGRDPACRLYVADTSVSRRHLQVVFRDGVFYLQNLSQYGSEIDGHKVRGTDTPVAVRSNLSVNIGKVALRCTLLSAPERLPTPAVLEAPDPAAPVPSWPVPAQSPEWPSMELAAVVETPAGAPLVAELYGAPPPGALPGLAGAARAPGAGGDGFPEPARAGSPHEARQSFDWTAGLQSESGVPAPDPVAGAAVSDPLKADAGGATVADILRAAGLRPDVAELYARNLPAAAVGKLLAELLQGLIRTLAARRSIKNTLRVAHTEMRSQGNNALKYALTPAEALIALIQPEQPGYLAPDAAIRDVFKDLTQHELALVDGVEGALRHTVELMRPDTIEASAPQADGKSLLALPGRREARLWYHYGKRFEELLGEQRAFSNQFLPAFRDAYEACLARLRRTEP